MFYPPSWVLRTHRISHRGVARDTVYSGLRRSAVYIVNKGIFVTGGASPDPSSPDMAAPPRRSTIIYIVLLMTRVCGATIRPIRVCVRGARKKIKYTADSLVFSYGIAASRVVSYTLLREGNTRTEGVCSIAVYRCFKNKL